MGSTSRRWKALKNKGIIVSVVSYLCWGGMPPVAKHPQKPSGKVGHLCPTLRQISHLKNDNKNNTIEMVLFRRGYFEVGYGYHANLTCPARRSASAKPLLRGQLSRRYQPHQDTMPTWADRPSWYPAGGREAGKALGQLVRALVFLCVPWSPLVHGSNDAANHLDTICNGMCDFNWWIVPV